MDKRVEKFQQIRTERKKVKLVILLFLVMIVAGLCVSDYSINKIANNQGSIKLISFERDGSSLYMNLLNHRFNLSMEGIGKELGEIKDKLAGLVG